MSDLRRAVEAEIESFTLDRTPPLSALKARKRDRDRRRYAVAGTALSVVAVAGIAAGSALVTGAQDRLPSRSAPVAAAGPDAAPGVTAESAARSCAAAAEAFDGEVVGAYPTTVADVRQYMRSPGSATRARDIRPGPFEFPAGWAKKPADARAAACYIDGLFPAPRPSGSPPAERALVMATGGVASFLVKAGPKDSIAPAPITQASEQTVTLPTSGWTPGSARRLPLVTGVVSARRDGDELCVVLEPLDARTADVAFIPVIWPKGYTATAYPLEIRGPDGQVVAREGQPLSFGGSATSPVEPGTPCTFGRSDAASVTDELPPA